MTVNLHIVIINYCIIAEAVLLVFYFNVYNMHMLYICSVQADNDNNNNNNKYFQAVECVFYYQPFHTDI